MKHEIFKLKHGSRQAAGGEPAGLLVSEDGSAARPHEFLRKEEFQWLAEIQNVLSPYWSARFDR